MRKLRLHLALLAGAAALAAGAQLTVHGNGNVHLGEAAVTDTTATLHIAGAGANGSRGSVVFGDAKSRAATVAVGEYAADSTDTDRLWLHGRRGLVYTTGKGDVALRHGAAEGAGFNFRTPVSARAAYIAADPRLNLTSTAVPSALDKLSGLSAISYRHFGKLLADEQVADHIDDPNGTASPDNTELPPPSKPMTHAGDSLHYGLSLASVQDVLSELVTEDEDGIKYVDYNSLVPLLVVAVGELRARVAELEAMQEGLDNGEVGEDADDGRGTADADDTPADALTLPALYQNTPNPFTDDTHIRYVLPESVAQADLYVFDLQGRQVKRIAVTGRGESAVTIRGSELPAGMYVYTLIADGREVASRRMILTK